MAYSSITTTEISVGKATKRSLWQKIKDNFDYLFGQTTPGGLLNGSFEYDTDGDGIPDNWTRYLYPGGSAGFETTNPEHGEKSYYFTHPGGAGNGGGYLDSDYIAVSPEQYTAQIGIRSSVTGIKNIVQVLYYDRSKAYLSSTDLHNATATNTTANVYEANYTPPSTCRFIKYRLIGGYTDTAVAGTTYFDGLRHFHVPDGSITRNKLAAPAVGDYIIHNNTHERSTSSGSYVKLKEIKIGTPGTYRIKFSLHGGEDGVPSPTNGYGRIYRNGAAVGTERVVSGLSYTEFSEDISGWSAGDLIQVYAHGDATVKEFKICVSTPLIAGSLNGY